MRLLPSHVPFYEFAHYLLQKTSVHLVSYTMFHFPEQKNKLNIVLNIDYEWMNFPSLRQL